MPVAKEPRENQGKEKKRNIKRSIWGYLKPFNRIEVAETAIRLGKHILFVAFILVVAWLMNSFNVVTQSANSSDNSAFAAASTTSTPTQTAANLPTFDMAGFSPGITRKAKIHTDVPSRGREEVITYTVKSGDTLFGISDKFGIKPETLLWGNQNVLGDNPHNLRPGQALNILPVDGAYHRWSQGDGLNGVANFFGVDPEDIINFPGNHLDQGTIGNLSNPNIEAGTWLVIPAGKRAFVSWSAPIIPRDDPGVAAVLGEGACDIVVSGVIGSGIFIWPADNHFLSGYDYNPEANHPAIDIDGEEGDPVYAADNGVIVYAGWNDWGYGNVIVVNHGNGWQTLYAHLNDYYVNCGQSVWQGNVIGTIGNTGNSTGSHLHFEMMINGEKVNPHNYLQ